MKLCFLADAGSIHTQKWVTFFANREHEVHLISFRKADIPKVKLHSVKTAFPLRISPVAPTYSKIGYLFSLRKIKHLVQEINPEILHAHWATSYGLIGAYSSYHPFVLSTWGSDVFDFPHKSFLHRRLLEYAINKADYLTATSKLLSKETKRYLKREGEIFTIPFGVNLSIFRPTVPKSNENIIIGCVKKLEKKYGIEYLIRAFAKLAATHPKLKLMIVGDGSEEIRLRELSKALRVENNIEFLGFVEHSRIPDYLSQMDIFVVPSIMSSETFGVAAVEAAACQLPVIASNIGGLSEVVLDGETGFLVPPQNPEAIAEKLMLLIRDYELRKKMGQAAREFVKENYVWEKNAEEMEKLYLCAANKGG